MSIFLDTSAFYALLDADDKNHTASKQSAAELRRIGERLLTSNYVVVETCALLHRRLGLDALRTFVEDDLPNVSIHWIDLRLHACGVNAVLMSSKGGPNLVDCVSFALMRELGVTNVFTFDRHFADQGFNCLP